MLWIASLRSFSPSTRLRTPVEDDIDVYVVRPGAETFVRPIDGSPKDWTLGEPPRKVTYVTLSQIVDFPSADAQSSLTYVDHERGLLVGVPTGFGLMQVLPDAELQQFKAAFKAARKR
jgi:hypothetical protein